MGQKEFVTSIKLIAEGIESDNALLSKILFANFITKRNDSDATRE